MNSWTSDGWKLYVKTAIIPTHDGYRLVHATWCCSYFSFSGDATFDNLLFCGFLVASISIQTGQSNTDYQGWWAGYSWSRWDISLDKHLQSNKLVLRNPFCACPITWLNIFNIVIWVFLHSFRVRGHCAAWENVSMKMIQDNCLSVIFPHSDKTILLNGCGQYSISLIIDVLSNDIDTTRCTGNE